MRCSLIKLKTELDRFLSENTHVAVVSNASAANVLKIIKSNRSVQHIRAFKECRHMQELHTKTMLHNPECTGDNFKDIVAADKSVNPDRVYLISDVENWLRTQFISIDDLILLNDLLRNTASYIIITTTDKKFEMACAGSIKKIRTAQSTSIIDFLSKFDGELIDKLYLYSTMTYKYEFTKKYEDVYHEVPSAYMTRQNSFIITITEPVLRKYHRFVFGTTEPVSVLCRDFSEPGLYISVMHAIACGHNTMPMIENELKIPSTTLNKYIKTLIEYEYLEEIISFDKDKNGRKRRYRITEDYYDFWFRFIYENRYVYHNGKASYRDCKKNGGSYLINRHIRRYCIEKIGQILDRNDLDVEYWWDKDLEIPLIIKDEKNETIYWGNYFFEITGTQQLEAMQKKVFGLKQYKRHYIHKFILLTTESFSKELTEQSDESDGNICLIDISEFKPTDKNRKESREYWRKWLQNTKNDDGGLSVYLSEEGLQEFLDAAKKLE